MKLTPQWIRRMITFLGLILLFISLTLLQNHMTGISMNRVKFQLSQQDFDGALPYPMEDIYIAGFFNDWNPKDPQFQFQKVAEDLWSVEVLFIPGENLYKFVAHSDGREHPFWFPDPTHQERADDGEGGENSVFLLPDYQSYWEIALWAVLIAISLYSIYLLVDGLTTLIFQTGLGQRAKFFVLVWLILLLSFGLNTIRSYNQQVALIKTGLDDSINLIHRLFSGENIDWSRLEEEQSITKFLSLGRRFFFGARALVRENSFSNHEIRFDGISLLDRNFQLLATLTRGEGQAELNRIRQRIGIPRIQDLYEKVILSPHITAGKEGRFTLGKSIYLPSQERFLQEKPSSYQWGTKILGFNAFLKPILLETNVVGYYGVTIHPQTLAIPLEQIFIYNGLLALAISAFLALFFFYQKKNPSHDQYLLGRFYQRFKLSPREREITKLLYLGYSNPEIANKIHVSPGTVKTHIYHVFKKAKVTQRIELIQLIQDMA